MSKKTITRPTCEQLKHPNQPIGFDDDGMIRFKANAIIRFLVDTSPGGLNTIARAFMHSHPEDYTQLMQLIGYSVRGFGELSSSPEEMVDAADTIAERLRAIAEVQP